MLKVFIAIFMGGGLGSVSRYAVQMILHEKIVAYSFPWATFSVNILGSFLIGLFYALSEKFDLSLEFRLFLTAGFCGGFTTFSTFSNDILAMMRQGDIAVAMLYIVLSLALGVGACLLGGWLASSRMQCL